MRGCELLDILEYIDPAQIEDADAVCRVGKPVWRIWGALAACLCLVVLSVYIFPRMTDSGPSGVPVPDPGGTIQREDEPGVYPNHPILRPGDEGYIDPGEGLWSHWDVHFNEATMSLDGSRIYIPGYFTEDLSEQEIAALEPGMRAEYMTYSGYAGFDGGGTLLDVVLNVTTSIPDSPVTVVVSDFIGCHYELPGEPVVSVCNHTEYTVYQLASGDTVRLDARAAINGRPFRFTLNTVPAQLDRAKEDFQRVLECFAHYPEGKPDLSAVTAEVIPEFFDRELTLSQAREDPDYGAYMLASVPSGFSVESIRRYKDQNNDHLSGLWTKGLANLSWRVTAFAEGDAARLTSVADTENYDLSLYPIPRAESVPEELREIVDHPIFEAEELTLETVYKRAYTVEDAGDISGWRMSFSVKFGDIVVEVGSKGVEPEWVYAQLMELLVSEIPPELG